MGGQKQRFVVFTGIFGGLRSISAFGLLLLRKNFAPTGNTTDFLPRNYHSSL